MSAGSLHSTSVVLTGMIPVIPRLASGKLNLLKATQPEQGFGIFQCMVFPFKLSFLCPDDCRILDLQEGVKGQLWRCLDEGMRNY